MDGALSWSVEWGGMKWDGVEVGVRRVEVQSQWGTELEGLRIGDWEREGEDEVMS